MQTLAIFLDAYRDLSARRLFWITMIISAVAIGLFGLLGVSDGNLNLLTIHLNTGQQGALMLYRSIFSYVVVGIWLTWAAVVLALVSTAGIFPDLLVSGTIDLYLARPIGRFRFFATKYATGLLFVALQVTVFAIGSYLVFGVRGHSWEPSLFLAIPLVVCEFSYLFAVCVLLGTWLRSTIGALMLTLLFWSVCSGLFYADGILYPLGFRSEGCKTADGIVRAVMAPLPRTVLTARLLDRWLLAKDDAVTGDDDSSDDHETRRDRQMGMNSEEIADERREEHSRATGGNPADTIGSSLVFEAVLFGVSAWIFCRRDY